MLCPYLCMGIPTMRYTEIGLFCDVTICMYLSLPTESNVVASQASKVGRCRFNR
jgi:hypothetical protein